MSGPMSLKILLVEDSPTDAFLTNEILTEAGHDDVVHVERLADAVGYIGSGNQIDLILLDLGLPDSQGLVSYESLQVVAPKIPIVVLTGNTDDELGLTAVQAGAQDFLVKGEYSNGELVRVIRYAVERDRIRNELRESEARFRLFVDGVRDHAIYTMDPDGVITFWNTGAEHIQGYSTEEALGQYHHIFFTPEDLVARTPERLRSVAAELGYVSEEGWRLRKDGSRFWANGSMTALFDNDGTLLGFCQVLRDLTERKSNELAMERFAETQVAILNALPAHIALLDRDGTILAVNDAWKNFASANTLQAADFTTGLNYLEVCERAYGECAEEAQSAADGIRSILRGEMPEFVLEYPCHSPKEKRWFRLMATSVQTDEIVSGAVVMHINITDRKLAEIERQRLVNELSERVKELKGLHAAAIVFRDDHSPTVEVLERFITILPSCLRYPEVAAASVRFGELACYTSNYLATPWRLESHFNTSDGTPGFIEIVYLEAVPAAIVGEGPFLPEERHLIDSLVEMLRAYLDRITAVQQLRASEQQFRVLFDHNPHPMWVYALETFDFLAVNDTAVEKYGYSRDEFLSMTLFDVRPEEDAERLRAHVAQSPPGYRDDQLWRHRFKDGTIIFADVSTYGLTFAGRHARLVLSVDVTKRLEAEQALKASEAHMRAILDTAPECIKLVSRTGKLLDMNPAGLRMIEAADIAEIHGKPFLEVVHPEDRALFVNLHQRVCRGESGQLEFQIVGLKGTQRRMETHSVPLLDDSGQVSAVLSVTRDVTERHQAQERLSLLSFALNSTRQAMYLIDEDSRIIEVNDEACRFHGFTHDELLQQRVIDINPELTMTDWKQVWQKKFQEKSMLYETQHLRKDGAVCPVEVSATLFEYGGRSLSVAFVRDITERHRIQEEMQRQAQLLRNAEQIGRMGSWIMDLIHERLDWSVGTLRIFGLTEDTFDHRFETFISMIHPEDRSTVEQSLHQAELADGIIESEYRAQRPDGELRWMFERGTVECNEDGTPIRRLGMVMDITDWKAIESEKQELLFREQQARREADAASRYYQSLFECAPGCYVVLTSDDYRVVAVSDAYLAATRNTREEIIGMMLFDIFPEDPNAQTSQEQHTLLASLEEVKLTGRANVMAVQRYPIRRPESEGGGVEDRYWSPVNSPVLGPDGKLAFIIHRVEDVTEYLRLKQQTGEEGHALQKLASRAELIEADIILRSQELNRAYEELAQSQALMRVASRVTRMGGWRVNLPDFAIVWSDEIRAVYETEPDYAPSPEEAFNFYVTEYQPVIRDAVMRCSGEGLPFDEECELITARGRRIWVRAIGEPVRDYSGEIRAVHGALQDITEQKLAERREHELAERFREMAENIQDVFYNRDPISGKLLYVSPAYDQIWGQPRESFYADPLSYLNAVHPDDRSAVDSAYQQQLSGNQTEIVYRILRPDAEIRWIRDRAYPIHDEEGTVIRIVGVARDITTSHQAKASLQISEERFRLLAKATNDAIWDWDLITNAVWWNEGLKTLFGYSPEDVDLSVEWWTDRIHPDDRDRVLTKIYRVIEGEEFSWSSEYQFQCKSGDYAYVLDRGYVIRDTTGRGVRMIGGMTDLTEKKHLEVQLNQSQKMEAIGQLAGGVAHDFNNLLTVINGYSELLMTMLSSADEMWSMLAEIRDAGDRAANLTRQLLAFSRKQVLTPQVIDLNAIVANIERMLARLIGEDIRVATVLKSDIPRIKVDPGQLEQVILNLAVNARDAMPNGGRLTIETSRIMISSEQADQKLDITPGTFVGLIVSDTGCGMSEEVRRHIFEPFFTTKDVGKGTGLGLATVFGIVKQSGGLIDVYSEVGVGTRFKILFPAVGDTHEPHSGHDSPLPKGNETVLLVEDENGVRQIARLSLEAQGYQVIEAANGIDAVRMFQEHMHRIRMIITDVVMPEMSGRELVEQLRQTRPQLKVLYMSGYTDDAIVRHGIIEATDAFLQKPFSPLSLARKVREVLDA